MLPARVASTENVTVLGARVRPPRGWYSGLLRLPTDVRRCFRADRSARNAVDQLPSHYPTPLSQPTLQRPQLTLREAARIGLPQPRQHHLRRGLGVGLEPPQNLRPHTL